jgi:hypothetical protein
VIQDNYYYPEISALPAGLSASVLKAGGVVGGSPSGALAAASQAGTAVKQQDAVIDDPLGEQLGAQRILRVSPLAPVRAVC